MTKLYNFVAFFKINFFFFTETLILNIVHFPFFSDIMALDKKHLFSIFVSKTLWILLIVFHDFNLVICDELEDDNLKKALEAIERRQRDLDLQGERY